MTIHLGPGEVRWAPYPQCPTHGQMAYNPTACRWVCKGFDGEGCPHTATAASLDWQLLGHGTLGADAPACLTRDGPHAI